MLKQRNPDTENKSNENLESLSNIEIVSPSCSFNCVAPTDNKIKWQPINIRSF